MRFDTSGALAGGLLFGSTSMLMAPPPRLLRHQPLPMSSSSTFVSPFSAPEALSSSTPVSSSSSLSGQSLSPSSSFLPGGKQHAVSFSLPRCRSNLVMSMKRANSGGWWGSLRGRLGRSSSSSSSKHSERRGIGQGSSEYTGTSLTTLAAESSSAGETVSKKSEQPKRVLLLISDTGGGHRASAQALEDALSELYPGKVECDIVDIWTKHAAWPYTKFVPAYKFMAKHPFIWRLFWFYGKMPISRFVQEKVTLISCFRRFKKAIESYDPDMVVSVHPLCQDIPLRALGQGKKGGRKLPFMTVVTDLGSAHPLWFDRRVDLCFVPSDPIRKAAEKAGLKPHQLRQHGLPIRSGFWKEDKRSKPAVRKSLGLKQDLPTTLVVGGGDGVGGITKIAESLAKSLGECDDCVGSGPLGSSSQQQLVVVCGKNEKIAKKLQEKADANVWGDGVVVNVQGFVSNMEDFMSASDCIVTKAGPGTIAESMCRGLPTMLSCFLPGQEAGNLPFVTEGGFGDYSSDPETIASTVAMWMRDPEKLTKMSELASSAGRPSATYDIARDLADVLFDPTGTQLLTTSSDESLAGSAAVA